MSSILSTGGILVKTGTGCWLGVQQQVNTAMVTNMPVCAGSRAASHATRSQCTSTHWGRCKPPPGGVWDYVVGVCMVVLGFPRRGGKGEGGGGGGASRDAGVPLGSLTGCVQGPRKLWPLACPIAQMAAWRSAGAAAPAGRPSVMHRQAPEWEPCSDCWADLICCDLQLEVAHTGCRAECRWLPGVHGMTRTAGAVSCARL